MPRVNAFGCFDDCNNFIGGYFLLKGKHLFSQIFFNHSPFMAYLSMFVQTLTHPQNLYEFILRHRQFLFLFGLFFNLLLIIRFGFVGFGFALFYEITKFYLFGDRFLAEGFIVYPLVYLSGLLWLKFLKKKIYLFDYFATVLFTWFIIFMREPYIPVALLLFGYILLNKKNKKTSIAFFAFFIILSLITFFSFNIPEFFFNVYSTNVNINFLSEVSGNKILGLGVIKIFLYPFFTLLSGIKGSFPIFLTMLSILFLIDTFLLIKLKKIKLIILLWLVLGFANFRYVQPGQTFYSSFHLLIWYGIFIFSSFMMLSYLYKKSIKPFFALFFIYFVVLIYTIFSPSFFVWEKVDQHKEFINNYGYPMQVGEVARSLSKPNNTLFVDGFDDIIYWQAQRESSYKYSWYTSLMPYFKKYTDAREEMFLKTPPDFYYGSCPKEKNPKQLLPAFVKNEYLRLYSEGRPTCLWVNKKTVNLITETQWKKAKENLYYLPL